MPLVRVNVGRVSNATLSPTARSTVNRARERARSDRAELYELLDSCLICHIGVVLDGAPVVLPTGYGRDGDTLYLHGSTGAASLRAAVDGAPVSVAVTRVDGVVYARSVFHHSMNYASAIIHGVATPVAGTDQKLAGLRALTEHLAPGSWDATRRPTRKELAATTVLALPLHEASVKLRSGPPKDDEQDVAAAATWAGVLPVRQAWGEPEPCPLLPHGTPTPQRVTRRRDSFR
jgi:uncharacterized protein